MDLEATLVRGRLAALDTLLESATDWRRVETDSKTPIVVNNFDIGPAINSAILETVVFMQTEARPPRRTLCDRVVDFFSRPRLTVRKKTPTL